MQERVWPPVHWALPTVHAVWPSVHAVFLTVHAVLPSVRAVLLTVHIVLPSAHAVLLTVDDLLPPLHSVWLTARCGLPSVQGRTVPVVATHEVWATVYEKPHALYRMPDTQRSFERMICPLWVRAHCVVKCA